MKTENPLVDKSYAFALRVVKLHRDLSEKKQEFVLSKQILRCGTSIGANVEEAVGGQSRKDFHQKISIAYNEARETHYWLRLLRDSFYIDVNEAESLLEDCDELLRIAGSILISLKNGEAAN